MIDARQIFRPKAFELYRLDVKGGNREVSVNGSPKAWRIARPAPGCEAAFRPSLPGGSGRSRSKTANMRFRPTATIARSALRSTELCGLLIASRISRRTQPRPTKACVRSRFPYCFTTCAACITSGHFSDHGRRRMRQALSIRNHRPAAARGLAKTALGAEETVAWEHHAGPCRRHPNLREQGHEIAAIETSVHATDLYDWQPRFPVCVLFGHEVDGLAEPCWLPAIRMCAFRCSAASIRSMSPRRAAS